MVGLGLLIVISPLFSSSPGVKGVTGLFEIAYPFTLSPGESGFSFGVDNIDLETGDVDVNRFCLGMGWGMLKKLELNVNLSYLRVKSVDTREKNAEYFLAGPWQTGPGYASLALKYNFSRNEKTGFGVLAYLDIRLSTGQRGVTTPKKSCGLELLFAHKFSAKTIFSLNLGRRFNRYPGDLDIDPGDSSRYAAGIETGITGNLSAVAQLAGKIYHGSDLDQDNPLDGIIGLKYENKNKYGSTTFGVSLAYKKNLAFTDKTLADSHGAVGSVWFYIGQENNSCVLPGAEIKSVTIQGDEKYKVGEITGYKAVVSPGEALTGEFKPVLFTWRVSSNGRISGQGSQVIDVTWEKPGKQSWVRVTVSNKCSAAEDKKIVSHE